MKMYKCLVDGYDNFKKGETYPENSYGIASNNPTSEWVDDFPKDWQYVGDSEIIGYNLKADCKEFEKAACKIAGIIGTTRFPLRDNNCLFDKESSAYFNLKETNVLDKWFTPVYSEPVIPEAEEPVKTVKIEIELNAQEQKFFGNGGGASIELHHSVDDKQHLGCRLTITAGDSSIIEKMGFGKYKLTLEKL